PAADTAPTSSGLLQGYMAPPMNGTRIPASRVRCVVCDCIGPEGKGGWKGMSNSAVRQAENVRAPTSRPGLRYVRQCFSALLVEPTLAASEPAPRDQKQRRQEGDEEHVDPYERHEVG